MTTVRQRASAGGTIQWTVDYAYDAFDRMVTRTIDADGQGIGGAVSTFFVYDGLEIVLALSSTGTVERRLLWGPGSDQLLASEDSGGVDWTLGDHLGTIRDVVDSTGTLITHRMYDSFGNLISGSTDPGWYVGFTGRFFDLQTGLQHNWQRWFDPKAGRWLSTDPIGFAAGDANLYRYVSNQPTGFTDPSGLDRAMVEDRGTAYSHFLELHGQRSIDPHTGQAFLNGSIRPGAPSFDQFYGNQWPKLRALIAEAQAHAQARMFEQTATLPPTVDGNCGTGFRAGFLTVGKYLTYPARWLGADFSRQDAALEEIWYRTGLNDHWSRTGTEWSAGVAATAAYSALGLRFTPYGSMTPSQAWASTSNSLYGLQLRTGAWIATRPPWMTSPWTYSAIGGGTTAVLTDDPEASLQVAALPILLFPERGARDLGSVFCGSNRVAATPQTPVPTVTRQRSLLRRQYLGSTPGKDSSATGRAVQKRMREQGLIRDTENGVEVQASNGTWVPIDETDMAHTTDAVKWWNEVGRHYGPKSAEVRKWMLDPNNYRLEWYSINRASGAGNKLEYLPPINDEN
jgi:RHS repeat-associated protein